MTFEELGAALRAEREKRHLSIDDVANQLKINPRLLIALESGDSSSLPHPAYARGFIRSYANFLGFSQDEIQQWLSSLQPGDLKKAKPVREEPQENYEPPLERQKKGTGRAVAAVFILCLLAGCCYWLWQSGRLPFLEARKEQPVDIISNLPGADTYRPQPAPPAEEKAPQTVLAPIQRTAPLPESATSRLAPPPKPSEPETSAATAVPAGQPGQTEAAPVTEQANETQIEPHKVVIVATEECWVHSTADKTDTRQFFLRKGDTFALTFAELLELKLGNAGGVRLRYDGNDMPPAGTSGQVRTLTFPPKSD